MWLFTVSRLGSLSRDATTHYVTMMQVLASFEAQTSTLNIWVKDAKSLFFRFFPIKPNYEHYKEHSTRLAIVHEIVGSGTSIPNLCIYEKIPRVKKVVQIADFLIIFFTGI